MGNMYSYGWAAAKGFAVGMTGGLTHGLSAWEALTEGIRGGFTSMFVQDVKLRLQFRSSLLNESRNCMASTAFDGVVDQDITWGMVFGNIIQSACSFAGLAIGNLIFPGFGGIVGELGGMIGSVVGSHLSPLIGSVVGSHLSPAIKELTGIRINAESLNRRNHPKVLRDPLQIYSPSLPLPLTLS